MSKTETNLMEHLVPLFFARSNTSVLDEALAFTGLSLEESRKECANQSKAQPHREKPAPER